MIRIGHSTNLNTGKIINTVDGLAARHIAKCGWKYLAQMQACIIKARDHFFGKVREYSLRLSNIYIGVWKIKEGKIRNKSDLGCSIADHHSNTTQLDPLY